jgi:hypothetical protein
VRFGNAASWVSWLNIASALAAFAASIFWLLSATPLPPMNSYYGGVPADDPFFIALQASARLSSRAAQCAALSAFLFAAATILQRLKIASWLSG